MRFPASIQISLVFVLLALACLVIADIEVFTLNPWQELARMAEGILSPSLSGVDNLLYTLAQTIAFALSGVALSCCAGFVLALIYQNAFVRVFSAMIRSVHELFWALIFLQMFGIHPLTGVLAIALPFTGIFAKVFAEILEENRHPAMDLVGSGSSFLSRFSYTHFMQALPHLRSYTSYRFECGLRSSTVLGFLGIPTLGYYLHGAFLQGDYSQVAAVLLLFYALVATLRYWMRPVLLPLYLLATPFLLGDWASLPVNSFWRFITVDIVPAPLRNNASFADFMAWLQTLLFEQALPGLFNTLVLGQIALVGTALLALLWFPLVSEKFLSSVGRKLGHVFLVIVRSTPEYILAFVFLLLWGPSLLPAIVALALHNGALIAHLVGAASNQITLRIDHARHINLYSYEVLPQVFRQFLAFLFYRWEIIIRESAILGLLGIHTLGFFVIAAMEELRFDRALVLIACTALLNIAIDSLSRRIRVSLNINRSINHKRAE